MIQKLQNIKAVSMDTSQWPQVSTTNTDNFNTSSSSTTRPPQHSQQLVVERKARPLKELPALSCPRCSSTNTKFCYYNNYSLTQPRYLCKACKRYWTHGGSLRNIPVGGGSRKNKKHPSGFNPSITNDLHPNPSANPIITSPPPILSPSSLARPSQVQDLNMSLAGATNSNYNNFSGALSAMELLRSTTASAMYTGGFGLHDFSSASSIDNGMRENGGRLLFPFGDLNELSMKSSNESGQQNYMGFWSANANLGGSGGSW